MMDFIECGLAIDDCGFCDCRLSIEIVDCIAESVAAIGNQQSQSTITIRNPQSENPQSTVRSQQFLRGPMSADDGAFDRAGESGVDPVTREVEPDDWRLGRSTSWLSWCEREGRAFLTDNGRAKKTALARGRKCFFDF